MITTTLGTLRSLIREAAIQAGEAGGKGLALYVFKGDKVAQVVIYDPRVILAAFEDAVAHGPEAVHELLTSNPREFSNPTELVKGMMTLSPPVEGECRGGWIVRAAAAQKGLGPLVYDIALTVAPNSTLLPDREQTSRAAGEVWRFYSQKRDDVKTQPLDNVKDPQTPPKEDDCVLVDDPERPWLDLAYTGSGDPVAFQRMRKNHESLVWLIGRLLKDNGLSVDRFRFRLQEFIGNVADDSFIDRYTGRAG